MTLRTLSVNEDGGRSERISAVQYEFARSHMSVACVKFSITGQGSMVIKKAPCPDSLGTEICLYHLDIDGLIDYLQQAKVFISENKTIDILMGQHDKEIYY